MEPTGALVAAAAAVAASGTLAAFASAASQGMNAKGALPNPPPPNTQETIDLWAAVQAAIQKLRTATTDAERAAAGNELEAARKAYNDYIEKTKTAAVPVTDTAAVPSPAPASPPPPPAAPAAPATADVVAKIVDEAIAAAEKAAKDGAAKRALIEKRKTQIAQHEYGGKRKKKGTRRRMHGGDRLFDALGSLGEGSPSPRPAFMKLITVTDDQVALELIPTFNTFISWEQSINGSRLFPRMLKGTEDFQKKFADALFRDVPTAWPAINPVFKKRDPISNYVRAAEALAAVAANRPRELTAEEAAAAAAVPAPDVPLTFSQMIEKEESIPPPPAPPAPPALPSNARFAERIADAESALPSAEEQEAARDAAANREFPSEPPVSVAPNGFEASPKEIAEVAAARAEIDAAKQPEALSEERQQELDAAANAEWGPVEPLTAETEFKAMVIARMKYASTKNPMDYTALENARAAFVTALGGTAVPTNYRKDIIKTDADVIEGAKDAYLQIYSSYKDTIVLPPGTSRAAVKDVIKPISEPWWKDRIATTDLGIVLTGSRGTNDAMKIIGKSEVYAAASKAAKARGADGGVMLIAAYDTARELGAEVPDPTSIIAERRKQTGWKALAAAAAAAPVAKMTPPLLLPRNQDGQADESKDPDLLPRPASPAADAWLHDPLPVPAQAPAPALAAAVKPSVVPSLEESAQRQAGLVAAAALDQSRATAARAHADSLAEILSGESDIESADEEAVGDLEAAEEAADEEAADKGEAFRQRLADARTKFEALFSTIESTKKTLGSPFVDVRLKDASEIKSRPKKKRTTRPPLAEFTASTKAWIATSQGKATQRLVRGPDGKWTRNPATIDGPTILAQYSDAFTAIDALLPEEGVTPEYDALDTITQMQFDYLLQVEAHLASVPAPQSALAPHVPPPRMTNRGVDLSKVASSGYGQQKPKRNKGGRRKTPRRKLRNSTFRRHRKH